MKCLKRHENSELPPRHSSNFLSGNWRYWCNVRPLLTASLYIFRFKSKDSSKYEKKIKIYSTEKGGKHWLWQREGSCPFLRWQSNRPTHSP